jgi:hypothetical protein
MTAFGNPLCRQGIFGCEAFFLDQMIGVQKKRLGQQEGTAVLQGRRTARQQMRMYRIPACQFLIQSFIDHRFHFLQQLPILDPDRFFLLTPGFALSGFLAQLLITCSGSGHRADP